MKYKILSICILLFTNGLLAQSATLKFHVEDHEVDELLIAYYFGDKQYIIGDEGKNEVVKLDANGNGKLTREGMKPGVYLVVFPPDNSYVEFVFEGKDLELHIKGLQLLDHPGNSVSNRLKIQSTAFQDQRRELEQAKPADLDERLDELSTEYYDFLEVSRKEHPGNMFLNILKSAEQVEIPEGLDKTRQFYYYRDHYFDNMDMSAPWLLRTPIFSNKINYYFENITAKAPDSIIASVDRVISLVEPNEELYQYVLVDRLNTYAKSKVMGLDKVYYHIAMNYYAKGKAPWADEEQLLKIVNNAKPMKGSFLGDKVADFRAASASGNEVSLYSIDSEFTILFMMDPYCGHCKVVSEDIIKLKDKFPTNSKLLGVVFNTTMEEMKKIKEERNYFWTCIVPSEEGQNELRRAFNLRSFPIIYLLDSEKKIIAKQLTIEQMLDIVNNS